MQIHKAYRIRIYPSSEQEKHFLDTINACRFVYNYYLDMRLSAYSDGGRQIPHAELSRDLTKLRKSTEWLRDIQISPLQQSLRTLDVAYSKFYRKESHFPRFRSRRDTRQSFRKPDAWSLNGNRLRIERNLSVRFRGTPPPPTAKLGTLTISRSTTGKWYASITCTEFLEQNAAPSATSIGIDLGLRALATTSDGVKYANPAVHKKQLKHLKLLQQSLARKDRDSYRYKKAKLEVARMHEKIANRRMNHLHQVSSAITRKNHALIAVEDLAVANMMKNRRLSRSIGDVAWGEFLRQLEYKQSWSGGRFVKIDRFFPSSKTCSQCNFIVDRLPLNIRAWDCPRCEAHHDRDINAAKNILKQAEVQLGVESTDGSPLAGESYRLDEARSVV